MLFTDNHTSTPQTGPPEPVQDTDRADLATAACSWAEEDGRWRQPADEAQSSALLQFLLQLFLEADGQDGEDGEHAEHSQGVPGHCLAGRGQFVQRCTCIDGYKGRRGHSCWHGRLNKEWDLKNKQTCTHLPCFDKRRISVFVYQERCRWRKSPKAHWWQVRWCWWTSWVERELFSGRWCNWLNDLYVCQPAMK